MVLTVLRSCVFMLLTIAITCVHASLCTVVSIVHRPSGYAIARQWCQIVMGLARIICGVRYRVTGAEHVPDHPVVVMARHESAWETMALVVHAPRQTWIIKRELYWVPLIGWCLWALDAIAINRSAGRAARDQVVEQGREKLAKGLSVTVFPEGTRVAPGQRKRYGLSGAMLSLAANAPILPVAHNAGDCWPRNAFVKVPGEIVLAFGPLIRPVAGQSAQSLSDATERWIEAEMKAIRSPHATPRATIDTAAA